MRLLPGAPLQLHDVRDVEAHCRTILARRLSDFGGYLDDAKVRERALTYLVETCWELSLKYNPDLGCKTFSTYSTKILEVRLVDWYRDEFGDSRYRCRCEEPQPDARGERCTECGHRSGDPDVISLEAWAEAKERAANDGLVEGAWDNAVRAVETIEEEVLTRVAVGR